MLSVAQSGLWSVKYEKIRKRCYLFVIIVGVVLIFATPLIAHADFFGYEIQDIYVQITDNVRETNDILNDAFEFTQVSPYDIIARLAGTGGPENIAIAVREASKTMALVVATLLLMVDFFRKSINFEWSSKWENILIFLVKIIVIKIVVQNADVIIGYIYAGFNSINEAATNTSTDFLPYGSTTTYYMEVEEDIVTQMKKGWWDFFYDRASGDNIHTYTYTISQEAVKMFYPTAVFPATTNLGTDPFPAPTSGLMFMPTMEIVLWQPYFLVMKALAYVIFVIAIGRVFELCIYTIFAPLPLCTFASDITHDVAKNFIKNYIAAVLQIAVIVIMFIVYVAVNGWVNSNYPNKLIQFVVLISLTLSVVKSGSWSKKVCGIA